MSNLFFIDLLGKSPQTMRIFYRCPNCKEFQFVDIPSPKDHTEEISIVDCESAGKTLPENDLEIVCMGLEGKEEYCSECRRKVNFKSILLDMGWY